MTTTQLLASIGIVIALAVGFAIAAIEIASDIRKGRTL